MQTVVSQGMCNPVAIRIQCRKKRKPDVDVHPMPSYTDNIRHQHDATSQQANELQEVMTETKSTYESLKTQIEDMGTNLMQKMSLLLEAQLQQTDTLLKTKTSDKTENEDHTKKKTYRNAPSTQSPAERKNDGKYSDTQNEDTTSDTDSATNRTWPTVLQNANRPNQRNIGTMDPTTTELQAGTQYAWIYIGRLHQSTTTGKVKTHIRNQGVEDEIECEELNTKGTLRAYKVGIPFKHATRVNAPEFWPEGVVVRRFRFQSRITGARLDC